MHATRRGSTGCQDAMSSRYIRRRAPIAQLAEAADLKSVQCRFESDWGHTVSRRSATIFHRPA
jgi:hypothetical protein